MPRKSVFEVVFHVGIIIGLTVALLAVFDTVLAAQEKVTIPQELPSGKFLMEQDVLFSQAVTISGQNSVGRQKVQLFWNLEILDKTGNRRATLKLRNMAIQTRSPLGDEHSFVYEASRNTGASEGTKVIYRALTDLTAVVEFDADWTPVTVTGTEDFLALLADDRVKNDENAAPLLPVLTGLFSPEMMKGYFNQLFYLRPAGPVAIGEAWTNETKLTIPEKEDAAILWDARLNQILNASGDRIAEVKGTGTIKIDEATEIRCDVETKFRAKTGLPFFVAFRMVNSRTDLIPIGENEEEMKTTSLFRTSQTITPL